MKSFFALCVLIGIIVSLVLLLLIFECVRKMNFQPKKKPMLQGGYAQRSNHYPINCCPRCKSNRVRAFVEKQVILPEKTKTQTSLNLNPLKPFTVYNHNEKVIRQEISRDITKFICDNCGLIYKR